MAAPSINSKSSVNIEGGESSSSSHSPSHSPSRSPSHSHNTNPEQVVCNNLDNPDETDTLEIAPVQFMDTFCDPDNPVIVNFHDITAADAVIRDGIERTPCKLSKMSKQVGMDLYMKMEFLQYTGSFKERGARYALIMLPDEQKNIGVIAASLGNHAQGLSYHAAKLEIPATVVMPVAAPIMKIQKCRKFGARVIVHGKDMVEAKNLAMQIANDEGLIYINGYDHPHAIAGQGTIGLEILEQVADPDAIIIPIGGGSLLAGIATVVKTLSPNTKIIGVESEKCPSFTNALAHGCPTYTPIQNTLADGLAVPTVGYNSFATGAPLIDRMLVVKEEWIALGILRFVEQEKCVVEGSAAAGLAAILSGQLDDLKGKKVVILLCGGNIDTTLFGRCLERGLAAEGRLVKFIVRITDRPGGMADLSKCLSELGVSIKDIIHERAWLKDIFSVEVKVVCETMDWDHSLQLKSLLKSKYSCVYFIEDPMAIHLPS